MCFDHRSEKRVVMLKYCLEYLMNNPILMNDIATAGLKVNETHSNEKIATEFLAEFESMKIK